MKKINPWIALSFALTTISIIITLLLYSKLPIEVPRHFNISGEVDGWAPKSFVLFTAFLPFILGGIIVFCTKLDPKRSAFTKHHKAYNIFLFAITLFMMGIHWATMLFALGYNIPINKFVIGSMGILFIIIGNYMPQIRPNYTFGIRTPWTLHDEDNWRATHRFGGYMFILIGLLALTCFFVSKEAIAVLFTIGVLVGSLGSYLYSYLYFRKHNTPK